MSGSKCLRLLSAITLTLDDRTGGQRGEINKSSCTEYILHHLYWGSFELWKIFDFAAVLLRNSFVRSSLTPEPVNDVIFTITICWP